MNKVTWLKEYLQEIQNELPAINKNRCVIDESTLSKYLNDHQTSQNMMLVGVLPDLNGKGTSADEFKLITISQLMVLKKTSYSEYNYDQFIGIFEETYTVIEDVLKKLLNDSNSGCTELRFLNTNAFKIVPVWNLSSCNGWKLMFDFDSNI